MEFSICGILVLITALVLPSLATEADEKELVETIISERMRLKSGHFEATGRFSGMQPGGVASMEVWFEGDFYRCEFKNNATDVTGGGTARVLFIGSDSYLQVNESNVQEVDRRTAKKYCHFFDVRAVGVATAVDEEFGRSVSEILRACYTGKSPARKLAGNAVGEFTLVRTFEKGLVRSSYAFDSTRGYCPTETKIVQGDTVEQKIVSDWELLSGVWVPKRTAIAMDGKPRGNMDFKWHTVNEPIEPAIFEIKELYPAAKYLLKGDEGSGFKAVPLNDSPKDSRLDIPAPVR